MTEWRTVAGHPFLEVSEHGGLRRKGQKPLRGGKDDKGYWRYCVWHEGRNLMLAGHRLVCEAWHGPRPFDGAQVAHRDGVRHSNHFSNLRWATAKENNADRYTHGTIPFGEEHPQAKLTRCIVAELRSRAPYKRGDFKRFAEEFGVSQTAIRYALRGKTWVACDRKALAERARRLAVKSAAVGRAA